MATEVRFLPNEQRGADRLTSDPNRASSEFPAATVTTARTSFFFPSHEWCASAVKRNGHWLLH